MVQGQKALDLKDITSGRFRPENIQGVIPMPDGEHYTQMSADGTQIIKYSFRTGEKVEVERFKRGSSFEIGITYTL